VITVTFSGPTTGTPAISGGGIVVVEYSGLDKGNPLDDVSAGYSYSGTSSTFDSGWAPLGIVAPLPSGYIYNEVIFGAVVSDVAGTPSVGSLFGYAFAPVESNSTGFCAITEELLYTASASNFQNANATCTSPGHWLAQMAAFRSATWSVAGGWTPARTSDEVNASQYPGPDICVQAANAGAANPHATILMVINGTQTCSVDPRGGWIPAGLPPTPPLL